jgi:hypothetical protein
MVVAVNAVILQVEQLLCGRCSVTGDQVEIFYFRFIRLCCACHKVNFFIIKTFACGDQTVA